MFMEMMLTAPWYDSQCGAFAMVLWLTLMLWLFQIVSEIRDTLSFLSMLLFLPVAEENEHTTHLEPVDKEKEPTTHLEKQADQAIGSNGDHDVAGISTGKVIKQTQSAKYVGLIGVLLRFVVALYLGWAGCGLLILTTSISDLILNSLALAFILEVDTLIFRGTRGLRSSLEFDCLESVEYQIPKDHWVLTLFKTAHLGILSTSTLVLVVFLGASLARMVQLGMFGSFSDSVHTACLFMGKSANPSLLVPQEGLCERLLQVTCAADVQGAGSQYGPCVAVGHQPKFGQTQGPSAYIHRHTQQGQAAQPSDLLQWTGFELPTTPQIHDLRQICEALYQPARGDFSCDREVLFESVFGGIREEACGLDYFKSWLLYFSSPASRDFCGYLPSNIRSKKVAQAIKKCRRTSREQVSSSLNFAATKHRLWTHGFLRAGD